MKINLFDSDNWREIGQTLSRNKTRTFLTAFGIFWGTAMLAMLLGGASGLRGMLERNFQGLATNMCFFSGGRTTMSYRGYNKGLWWSLTQTDVRTIKKVVPEIEYSSTLTNYSGIVAAGSKSKSSNIMGVEAEYTRILTPVIYEGRFINESDINSSRKVCLLGKNMATELFGMGSPIGKYVSVNGIYYLCVGVVGQLSEVSMGGRMDDNVVLPSTTMQIAYNTGEKVDMYAFTLKRGLHLKDVQDRIERVIRANHPIHPEDENAFWFGDVSEQFRMADNLFLGVSILALFVGAGTLLAGIIGVANIMWIIVRERTQEIGIRRAIGARPMEIVMQILSEGMVLTTIAGLLGLTFATIVLAVADRLTTDPMLGSAHFGITFSDAVSIMLTFVILGSAAGLIPAIKAMKIKPIEALNAK